MYVLVVVRTMRNLLHALILRFWCDEAFRSYLSPLDWTNCCCAPLWAAKPEEKEKEEEGKENEREEEETK